MNFLTEQGKFQLVSDEVGVAAADPGRRAYAYTHGSGRELLAWPVALAQASGYQISDNWEWGVRAVSYEQVVQQKKELLDTKQELEWVVCPADRVGIASAYYPRNKGAGNNGLRGAEDPRDEGSGSAIKTSYWGRLSYAINEDIVGAEVSESDGARACWRAIRDDGGCTECLGEMNYPPGHPCSGGVEGWRLRGNLDKVYSPADVGLIFEGGRDTAGTGEATGFANLVLSAGADGPYLGDFQQALGDTRMPNSRHPKGTLNVLYADMHGGTVRPVKYSEENGLPEEYSPRPRVSPYPPAECDY